MFGKKPKSPLTPPEGCGRDDIATQSSICTGETLIGFRRKGSEELLQASLVRGPADIRAYYAAYGFAPPEK